MAEDRFDGLFLTLDQQSQGIEPLLDNLFSFLRRKSDFFNGATPDKIEKLVLETVRKHAALAERDAAEKKLAKEKEEKAKKDRLEKKRLEEEAKRAAAAKPAVVSAPVVEAPKSKPVEDDVIELSDDGSFDISTAKSVEPEAAVQQSSAATATASSETAEPKDDEEDDKSPARKLECSFGCD